MAIGIFAGYSALLEPAHEAGPRNAPSDEFANAKGVSVAPGKLVLPSKAGRPASIYLRLTNNTGSHLYIREARLLQVDEAGLVDLDRTVNARMANIPVGPGETLTTEPPSEHAILTQYDASVVPGAKVQLELVFSDDSKVRVPLVVESVLGEGGRIRELPSQ